MDGCGRLGPSGGLCPYGGIVGWHGGYGGNGDSRLGHMISAGKRFGTYLLFLQAVMKGK